MLAIAGISTSMILTGCATDSAKYVNVNGKKYKKEERNGEEGYVNGHGTFIPFHTMPSGSRIESAKKGNSGIGSSVRPSGRGSSS